MAYQRTTPGLEVDGEYGALTHSALMAEISAQEGEKSEDESQTLPAGGQTVIISGNTVNVRKGPETGYGIVTIVRRGETYPYIATAPNGWLCIKIGDGTAWISNKYSSINSK